MYSEQGSLSPCAPYDFAQSMEFLSRFSPMREEQVITSTKLVKAVMVAGRPLLFRLTDVGSIWQPAVGYELFADEPLDAATVAAAVDRIRFFLSLDDDLNPFYKIGEQDVPFAPLIQKLYGYHQVKFLTPFENAAWAILTQRSHAPVANKKKQQIMAELGGKIEFHGRSFVTFPEAGRLAAVNVGDLAALIAHAQKAEYISAAALAFKDVNEQWLRGGDYDEVESWLRAIKGIGDWSASFILLRGLGRMERTPVVENRFIEAAAHRYAANGGTLDRDQVAWLARRYGDYQGYWAHYIRAAADDMPPHRKRAASLTALFDNEQAAQDVL